MAYDPYAMTRYPQGYYNQQPGQNYHSAPAQMPPYGGGATASSPAVAPQPAPYGHGGGHYIGMDHGMFDQNMGGMPPWFRRMMMTKTGREDMPYNPMYQYMQMQNYLAGPGGYGSPMNYGNQGGENQPNNALLKTR